MTGKDLYQHGLTMVIAPVADGVAVEMMAKTSIEKACLSEAQWYFMQVHNTPLLLEPLLSILERSALTPKLFQEVLQGNFVPLDTCNSYVKKFLQACKLPTGLTTILPQEINSYMYGWHHIRKQLLLLCLASTLAHYMAGTYDSSIVRLNALVARISLKTGYSPMQWQKIINVMLEKIPGIMTWL